MIENNKLTIKGTIVFRKNYNFLTKEPNLRFAINQGGSRSSKTYSLCQIILLYAIQNPGSVISVIRKTLPALKGSILKDLKRIIEKELIPQDYTWNKTEGIITLSNGSEIEYFSADDSQKLRGRKRDIALLNEANELSFEDFVQINMRTNSKIFIDFNPSMKKHWIYDLIDKPESLLIKSTYKDNTFLDKRIVQEIERLIEVDEDYHRVYALGLPPIGEDTIYTHFKEIDSKDLQEIKSWSIGLDFGYKHPTACVLVGWLDEHKIYAKELLYESHLTSNDLIQRLKDIFYEQNINTRIPIYADYARPEIISDLRKAGFNVYNAKKDVLPGIDSVKSKNVLVDKTSSNILNEITLYKWKKDREGNATDNPIKLNDDALDALRYGVYSHYYRDTGRGSSSSPRFAISSF